MLGAMESISGLDPEALNRARISRDPRFDGKFFIAVASTGIYCRPICPSRYAKRSNVRFFGTPAAAEAAGFRPCLRCRPEAAPGTPAWLGTAAVVRRALRLINDGALDEDSVETLAGRLGIGARHLVRLFARHVGASPIAVAQTRRLHFAVCLLTETRLPITQIAMAAGFGSCRRFNDAFRRAYGRTPRELRRAGRRGGVGGGAEEVVLKLAYRPPFDWTRVGCFLAARATTRRESGNGDRRRDGWPDTPFSRTRESRGRESRGPRHHWGAPGHAARARPRLARARHRLRRRPREARRCDGSAPRDRSVDRAVRCAPSARRARCAAYGRSGAASHGGAAWARLVDDTRAR